MIPIDKLKDIIKKHSKLEIDLSSENIDKKKFADMSKEYSDLNEIIEEAKFYCSFEDVQSGLKKIIDDKDSDGEMTELKNIEFFEIIKKKEKIEKKLKIFLLPKDEADKKCYN